MTRFYFSAIETVSGVSATTEASWTSFNAGTSSRRLRTAPIGAAPAFSINANKVVATNPTNVGVMQFVSDAFPAAGSITSGTLFKMVLPVMESASTDDAMMRLVMRIVSGDGTTVRGTIYAGPSNTTVASSGDVVNREFPITTAKTRYFTANTSSTVAWQLGDRLVVEVGARFVQATTAGQAPFHFTPRADAEDYAEANELAISTALRPWLDINKDFYTLSSMTAEEYRFGQAGYPLNKDTSTMPFVDLEVIDGIDSTPVRVSQADREGIDGALINAEFEGARTITLQGNLYASPTAVEVELNKLKENFAPSAYDTPLFWLGDNDTVYHVMGKSLGLRYSKSRSRGIGVIPIQVQIVCQDPRIYSGTDFISSTSATIVVTGNRTTPGLITLKALSTAAGPVVLTQSNLIGEHVYTFPTMNAGDIIELDLDARTIIKNGTVNLRATTTITPSWGYLYPGSNSFILNYSAGTVEVTIKYKPAFR